MLLVREATALERGDWDGLVARFENHRIVHTRAWIEWLQACGCGRPLYLVFQRDGAIVGAIPGLLVRMGLLRLYGSPLPGWQAPEIGPVVDPRHGSAEVRGGHSVSFGEDRARELFRHIGAAGKLLAISVYLPDGVNIATGLFTVDGRELLLWSWAHRTAHRWFRPTELLTWTVMTRAMAAGCETFDFMGLGDFKTKFGAELDATKYRWVRSRYGWLVRARDFAERGYRWQQSVRGRIARMRMFGWGRSADDADRAESPA